MKKTITTSLMVSFLMLAILSVFVLSPYVMHPTKAIISGVWLLLLVAITFLILKTGKTSRYRSIFFIIFAFSFVLSFIAGLIEERGSMALTQEVIDNNETPLCPVAIPHLITFSLGRLLAYTSFGALVGFLGARITHPAIRAVMGLGMIGLSIALIVYAFIRGFSHFSTCRWFLKSGYVRRLPILAGILTGFNVCPPFLLVIQAIYTEGSIGYGVGFFLVFYLSTSMYLIPFVFLGRFSLMEPVRWVARVSAVVSGCIFFATGLRMFISA